MPFGFFNSQYSDQGLMDDDLVLVSYCRLCVGNIISLLSLTFIIGLKKQFKTMFAPVRFWATVVYLSLLVVTVILSVTLKIFFLSLILVIVQFGALVWYSASYIPYGREIIRRFFGGCITSI
ncbi:Got1/Sft2-like family-domain-containing protein [Sporodiniella umbellata]|nr:Got1/Sft2-like family-domain-containing protein [Sporodiniella umbellata]